MVNGVESRQALSPFRGLVQLRGVSTALLLGLGLACGSGAGDETPEPVPGAFVAQSGTTASSLDLIPFDVNRTDRVGPGDWHAQYGKLPEIVASPNSAGLDVALRSYGGASEGRILLLRFSDGGAATFTLEKAYEAPSLGLLLGLASAPDGGFYFATGTEDAQVSASYPPVKTYRSNIVRVYRASAEGQVLFDVDLDPARHAFKSDAEPLINPGVASSARLALAGGQLALVHGINTAYDAKVEARHQKAISTYLDAQTGTITAAGGIWCSHSFDQRYLADGSDLYELHLGDAHPRQVVVSRVRSGRAGSGYGLCSLKGALGANNTFTRLGGLARIDAGSGSGGYLGLFSMEHGNTVSSMVNSSRDLALVRTVSDFASGEASQALDTSFGSTFTVTSSGSTVTNRLLWITDYEGQGGTQHAERPKLVALGGGEFLVLWERWTQNGDSGTFDGTYALRINGAGSVLAAATRVSGSHLPRGDDAFLHRGFACFVTGDELTGKLTLHRISPALEASEITLLP